MKAMCAVAVVILGIQSLCVGFCLGTPNSDAPRCHAGTLPNNGDRSHAKTDRCIDALAIESKHLLVVPNLVGPVLGHEEARLADLAHGFAVNRILVNAETARAPSLRIILRI